MLITFPVIVHQKSYLLQLNYSLELSLNYIFDFTITSMTLNITSAFQCEITKCVEGDII